MNEKELISTASDAAEELIDAESYPFVEGWRAWRVRGKWFMLATTMPANKLFGGKKAIILKAPPEDVTALQAGYADIGPAYHMNKRHWYTVYPGDSIDPKLVRELVQESYAAVVQKLPKAQRPAGWQEAVR
ncbi:MmcQ/YjbR family DNA-binding protein [Corynebacterium simulans]|uniref:MmcQ/YjbR family DNA-binding protein n=1 Tax=Corynebacterium simulans TaxID=146827 RepID=UPI0030CB8342